MELMQMFLKDLEISLVCNQVLNFENNNKVPIT